MNTTAKYRKFECPSIAATSYLDNALVENMASIANIVSSLTGKAKQANPLASSICGQQTPQPLSCININNVPQTLL